MPVRVVCFDLGGVVVRICRSWDEACARAGVRVKDPERFADPVLAAERKTWVDRYQTGRIACEEFWAGVASASGGLYSPDEVRAVHLAWTLEDYEGMAELISAIRGAGMTSACLSNTNHAHWVILREGAGDSRAASRAIGLLDRHLVSHELRAAKPDAAIYESAERALGFARDEIVFFDDLEENVEAALRRGWRAFVVDHHGDTAGQIRGNLRSLGLLID